jgi:hypothetical protein
MRCPKIAGKIQYLPFIVFQLKDIREFRSAAADTFELATGAFLFHIGSLRDLRVSQSLLG